MAKQKRRKMLSIIRKRVDNKGEEDGGFEQYILPKVKSIRDIKDPGTMQEYVSSCLDLIKQEKPKGNWKIADAEVTAAKAVIHRAPIYSRSAVPSQVTKPITTQTAGLGVKLVYEDGKGHTRVGTIGARSVFKKEELSNLMKVAYKTKIDDPDFRSLPSPVEGEQAHDWVSPDEELANLDGAEVNRLAHRVVRGAHKVYAEALDSGKLKMENETKYFGPGLLIEKPSTNFAVGGHVRVATEIVAKASTTGIKYADMATKIKGSAICSHEEASPKKLWGFKRELKGRDSGLATHLKDFNPEEIGASAARKVVELAEADSEGIVLPSGVYHTIVCAQPLSEVATYVLSRSLNVHGLEFPGHSVFPLEEIGKKVTSDKISIHDDPTIDGPSYTSEGIPTQKTTLIDHGVYKEVIKDDYLSKKHEKALKAHGLDTRARNGFSIEGGIRTAGTYAHPTPTKMVIEGHDGVPFEQMLSDAVEKYGEVVVMTDWWYSYPVETGRKDSEHPWGAMTSSSPGGSYLAKMKDGKLTKTPLKPNRDRALLAARDILSNVEQVSLERKAVNGWAADFTTYAPEGILTKIELVEVGKFMDGGIEANKPGAYAGK